MCSLRVALHSVPPELRLSGFVLSGLRAAGSSERLATTGGGGAGKSGSSVKSSSSLTNSSSSRLAESSLEASLETDCTDPAAASDSAGVAAGGDSELGSAGGGGVLGRLNLSEASTEEGKYFSQVEISLDFLWDNLVLSLGLGNSTDSTFFGLLDLLKGLTEDFDAAFNCGDLEVLRPDFLTGAGGESEGEGDLGSFRFLEGPAVPACSSLLDC